MAKRKTFRNFLLVCGILSSLNYIVADTVGTLHWEGYSYLHQTVSELLAMDAPSRPYVAHIGFPYGILVIAFGFGVLVSGQSRARGMVAGLLVAFGVVCLAGPFIPMHMRGVAGDDVPHIVCAAVDIFLIFLIVGFGSGLFGKTFRRYSIGTMGVMFLFGFLTGLQAPRIAANLPTPWAGLTERVDIFAYLLWFAVLAVILLREKRIEPWHENP